MPTIEFMFCLYLYSNAIDCFNFTYCCKFINLFPYFAGQFQSIAPMKPQNQLPFVTPQTKQLLLGMPLNQWPLPSMLQSQLLLSMPQIWLPPNGHGMPQNQLLP